MISNYYHLKCYSNIMMYVFYVRGQVLHATSLKMNTTVELIRDDVKYVLSVSKIAENGYFIQCNNTAMEVDIHKLVAISLNNLMVVL